MKEIRHAVQPLHHANVVIIWPPLHVLLRLDLPREIGHLSIQPLAISQTLDIKVSLLLRVIHIDFKSALCLHCLPQIFHSTIYRIKILP